MTWHRTGAIIYNSADSCHWHIYALPCFIKFTSVPIIIKTYYIELVISAVIYNDIINDHADDDFDI